MCTDCKPNGPVVSFPVPETGPCNNCDNKECASGLHSTDCLYYKGPDLACLQVKDEDRLSVIFQKIDEQLCISSGGIELGNIFCLSPLDNFDEWVSAISEKYCTLSTELTLFKNSTFPSAIAAINQNIDRLNKPELSSCNKLGITTGDNIKTILTKLSSAYCTIVQEDLDISTLKWPDCFIFSQPPADIKQGLKTIADKVCVIESLLSTNPDADVTFDNTGSCLPAPGSSDSLVSTITKIKSRLCQSPIFNAANLVAGCIGIAPADTLELAMGKTVSVLTELKRNAIVAVNTSQFTISAVDPTQNCSGKVLSLNGSLTDRHVAASPSDTTPGTLSEKIASGTGITISTDTVPGKLVISSASAQGQDYKVKVNGNDANAGYLLSKMKGASNTLCSVTVTEDNGQAKVSSQIDVEGVLEAIFEMLETDVTLRNRLCSILTKCPSPCSAPTNVQAIPIL